MIEITQENERIRRLKLYFLFPEKVPTNGDESRVLYFVFLAGTLSKLLPCTEPSLLILPAPESADEFRLNPLEPTAGASELGGADRKFILRLRTDKPIIPFKFINGFCFFSFCFGRRCGCCSC